MEQKKLQIGAAEVVITPPIGTGLAGYFHQRESIAVKDDLYAKALVASKDGQSIVLVACDLIAISGELIGAVRALMEERTGIPGLNVMLCATHCHTGPDVRDNRIAPRNEEWFAELPQKIVEAVVQANENKRASQIFIGRTHEEGLAFNRRFRLPDSKEQFGTGGNKENVVDSAGPTDPEFGVIKICDADGKLFALLINYTLHIDVMGGNELSADYPARLTHTVREVYGDEVISIFTNGAAGNINHVNYLGTPHVPQKGEIKSLQIGRALGGAAINVAEKAPPSKTIEVAAANEIVAIPYHPVDDVVEARLKEIKSKESRAFFDDFFVELVEKYELEGKYADVEVQALRLGDAVFVGIPGELFVEWGLEIKRWSPMPFTFVVELANNCFGYIPTYEAFRRGGYEPTPIVSAQLTQQAGQMMADAAFRLIRKLK